MVRRRSTSAILAARAAAVARSALERVDDVEDQLAVGGVGPQGPEGPQGPAGADGSDGAQGPAGAGGLNGHVELANGYAEILSLATEASTSFTAVTGLTVTVTVGDRPIIVEAGGSLLNNSSTGGAQLQLVEGTTELKQFINSLASGANKGTGWFMRRRLTPTPGSHTYSVRMRATTTGNAQMSASATDPAWLQVTEV